MRARVLRSSATRMSTAAPAITPFCNAEMRQSNVIWLQLDTNRRRA
jgi:hypothetical protein